MILRKLMKQWQSANSFWKKQQIYLKMSLFHVAQEIIDGFPLCCSQSVELRIFSYLYQ